MTWWKKADYLPTYENMSLFACVVTRVNRRSPSRTHFTQEVIQTLFLVHLMFDWRILNYHKPPIVLYKEMYFYTSSQVYFLLFYMH